MATILKHNVCQALCNMLHKNYLIYSSHLRIIIPILQMKKLKLGEIRYLTQQSGSEPNKSEYRAQGLNQIKTLART